jgi:hypothetical protein
MMARKLIGVEAEFNRIDLHRLDMRNPLFPSHPEGGRNATLHPQLRRYGSARRDHGDSRELGLIDGEKLSVRIILGLLII